jgi:hypothetical protein
MAARRRIVTNEEKSQRQTVNDSGVASKDEVRAAMCRLLQAGPMRAWELARDLKQSTQRIAGLANSGCFRRLADGLIALREG